MPERSEFDPLMLPESNATGYPEPYRAANQQRWNRHLGNHANLTNFGVNITHIVPGGQSSARHAHSRQDEFVYVLQGEVDLETDAGVEALGAGMCAGFRQEPAMPIVSSTDPPRMCSCSSSATERRAMK